MWKGELDKIFQVRAAQKPLFLQGDPPTTSEGRTKP